MPPSIQPSPRIFRALLLAGGLISCTLSLASAWPSQMRGKWEVVQVAVDARDQPHWQYFPDDPRLMGRELVIGDSSISLNDDSRECSAAVSKALPSATLQQFIGKAFPRPVAFDTPTHPTLADFGLKFPASTVSPISTRCSPDNSPWNGAWWIQISPDRALTNYDNSGYVLVLQRQVGNAQAKPSFSCGKAHGDAEQTICSSTALAGYDRSVTAAYHRAMGTSDDKAALKQEQIEWMKTRNDCARDTACLEKSMRDRVDQLMQP
jgi:uncharacterized protein YecT (DUF1311 family)